MSPELLENLFYKDFCVIYIKCKIFLIITLKVSLEVYSENILNLITQEKKLGPFEGLRSVICQGHKQPHFGTSSQVFFLSRKILPKIPFGFGLFIMSINKYSERGTSGFC